MPSCPGCGSTLDPTQQEVNQAVDEVLVASLKDAKKHGEICPLCGHSQAQPVSHRKSVQFALLLATFVIACAIAIAYFVHSDTERNAAAEQAFLQIESNPQLKQMLGSPVAMHGRITGQVKEDETGWHEANLVLPIHGPKGDATVQISGGRGAGPWQFTTIEVVAPQLKEKADLITGKIVIYDTNAYVITHTEAAKIPAYALADVPAPSWDGQYPCVYALARPTPVPVIGSCTMPVPMSAASRTDVDYFQTDLRTGKFILRQTDLSISEPGFDIPLTRTYTAQDWLPRNESHAFGRDSNHPYDIAPLGTRNPYTEQFLVLEDGDFLYFPRISKGTGYSDAVYCQSEVGDSFYKAVTRWDGNGWLMQMQDGSTIHFPESYLAKNLAQGAPTEMTDAAGNTVELLRDSKRDLREIRGPNGSSIKLFYDNRDRIVRAEDGRGRWAAYTYNPSGFLTGVKHSDGTARYYYYEDDLLTWIRDENGVLLLHNTYDGRWLTRQYFGNAETFSYHYDLASNRKYAERVSVTLPDGSLKTVETANSVSSVYKRTKNSRPNFGELLFAGTLAAIVAAMLIQQVRRWSGGDPAYEPAAEIRRADGIHTAEYYARAWRDCRRRRFALQTVQLSCVPMLVLACYWASIHRQVAGAWLAAGWFLAFFSAGVWLKRFRCPRCGKLFYWRLQFKGYMQRESKSKWRCCRYCGLTQDQYPSGESQIFNGNSTSLAGGRSSEW